MTPTTTLLKNAFVNIEIDFDDSLVFFTYSSETKNMQDEDMKKILIDYKDILLNLEKEGKIQKTSLKFLNDLQKMDFIINNDLQVWIDTNAILPISHLHYKTAMLIPEEFFTNLSVELVIDEDNTKKLSIRNFANKKDALEWLKL